MFTKQWWTAGKVDGKTDLRQWRRLHHVYVDASGYHGAQAPPAVQRKYPGELSSQVRTDCPAKVREPETPHAQGGKNSEAL